MPFYTQGANLTVKGSLTTRGEYDDNIFLTPNNEIEDFITTVSPGISGEYRLNQNNFFDFLYGPDFIFHKKDTPFVQDEIRHNLNLSLNLNPMKYLLLNVTDTYSLIPIDTREPGRFKGKFNNLAQRNFFQIVSSFKYPLGPTSYTNLEMRYNKSSVNKKGINEKEELGASVEIGKSFSSATKGSLNYRFSNNRQTESQNYNLHSFSGKIIYNPSERIESNLTSGYNKRIISSNEDLDSWNINFNLTGKISPTMDIGLGINRSLEDNEERRNAKRSAVERTGVTGSASYRILERAIIKVNGFYQLNSFKQVDREDKLLGGSLNFSIYFSKYLALLFTGNYNRNNFSSELENRTDKTFLVSGAVEFQPYEWIKFGSRIQSEERDSNAVNSDYSAKRYSFYGTIMF